MAGGDLDVVRVPGWEAFGWLRHGFSARRGGVSTVYGGGERGELNLGYTREDDPAAVGENRRRFVESVAGTTGTPMVGVRQVHGTRVVRVGAGQTDLCDAEGRGLVEADGVMTSVPGVMVAVQTADCVPVLVADVKLRVVAAFHAGWRGTAAGMVELGIAGMVAEFGCSPKDMVAAVGPAIGGCCYTVGEELRSEFLRRYADAGEFFEPRADGLHLDLAEANRRQLAAAGVRAEGIWLLGECTACARQDGRRRYFSHRAEAGCTGRAMGMIGVIEGA
jgi:YfiH family protein